MSTTRSLSTGSPLIGSSSTSSPRSLVNTLQASRFTGPVGSGRTNALVAVNRVDRRHIRSTGRLVTGGGCVHRDVVLAGGVRAGHQYLRSVGSYRVMVTGL